MACTATNGRTWQCKEQIGGVKYVYFANFDTLSGLTVTSGAIASVTGTLYKYELPKSTANVNQNINASPENGTFFVEQVLEMVLHKMTATDRQEIKVLATGRPQIIVEDNNGVMMLLGLNNGCDVTGGSSQTGTAEGDLSGYNLTFTGKEDNFAPFVTSISSATIVTS